MKYIKCLIKPNNYKKTLNKHRKDQTLIIILTNQTMSDPIETAKVIIEYKKQNKQQNIIPVFLGANSIRKANKLFHNAKIPYFNTLKGLIKSL